LIVPFLCLESTFDPCDDQGSVDHDVYPRFDLSGVAEGDRDHQQQHHCAYERDRVDERNEPDAAVMGIGQSVVDVRADALRPRRAALKAT
jgi:hypothetical protein